MDWKEIKHIANQWTTLRKEEGIKDARKIPAIADWLDGMSNDQKRIAHGMFGENKPNQHG